MQDKKTMFLTGISKYAPDKRIESIICVRQMPADFCRSDQKGDNKNAITICKNR